VPDRYEGFARIGAAQLLSFVKLTETIKLKLKPHVCDAAAVARKIVPCFGIVVDERDRLHGFQFRESQIEANRSTSILSGTNGTPVDDASALRTEVKFKPLSAPEIDLRGA